MSSIDFSRQKGQISTEDDEDEQNKETKPSASTSIDTTVKPKLVKKIDTASTSKSLVKAKKPVVSDSNVKPVVAKAADAAPHATTSPRSVDEPSNLESIPIGKSCDDKDYPLISCQELALLNE